jgi:hypothetical protein
MRIHLLAALAPGCLSQQLEVPVEHRAVMLAERLDELRRAFNIREEKRQVAGRKS